MPRLHPLLAFTLLCALAFLSLNDHSTLLAAFGDGEAECAPQPEEDAYLQMLREQRALEMFDKKIARWLSNSLTKEEQLQWLGKLAIAHRKLKAPSTREIRDRYTKIEVPEPPDSIERIIEEFEFAKKRGGSEHGWRQLLRGFQNGGIARYDAVAAGNALATWASVLSEEILKEASLLNDPEAAEEKKIVTLIVRNQIHLPGETSPEFPRQDSARLECGKLFQWRGLMKVSRTELLSPDMVARATKTSSKMLGTYLKKDVVKVSTKQGDQPDFEILLVANQLSSSIVENQLFQALASGRFLKTHGSTPVFVGSVLRLATPPSPAVQNGKNTSAPVPEKPSGSNTRSAVEPGPIPTELIVASVIMTTSIVALSIYWSALGRKPESV